MHDLLAEIKKVNGHSVKHEKLTHEMIHIFKEILAVNDSSKSYLGKIVNHTA
jgi:hypothetical protein